MAAEISQGAGSRAWVLSVGCGLRRSRRIAQFVRVIENEMLGAVIDLES